MTHPSNWYSILDVGPNRANVGPRLACTPRALQSVKRQLAMSVVRVQMYAQGLLAVVMKHEFRRIRLGIRNVTQSKI
jgi:hypothetical protein